MEFLDEIQNWIDDSKVVTYRTVAYFLDVHVNTAKMMLFTYYNQNEKNLDAVYWIFGKLSQDKGMKATLATQKKRKLVEESFDSIISEHLYAIAKSSSQEFDVTDIYKAETEIRKTQSELGQNSGLKPSLRGIKNNNCSIIKKNIVHQSVKETPKVAAEVSATETKPSTQEQESKKNGKSKSTKGGKSAISDMFSKKSSKATENKTKTEVNSEVKPKPSQEKEVIKAKSNGLKGKFPSQAISELFAKAPPKKKTDSQEYNIEKDDVSPGKENSENNLPRNKDAKMRTISKKREKSQPDETSNSKRRKRIQVSTNYPIRLIISTLSLFYKHRSDWATSLRKWSCLASKTITSFGLLNTGKNRIFD